MSSLKKAMVILLSVAMLCGGATLLQPLPSWADNNARDYIPAPPGIFAILTYYEHISAQSFYLAGNRATSNLEFTGNVGILRLIYYGDLPTPFGPIRWAPQVLVPFGTTTLDSANLNASGFGNPFILAQFWLYRNDKTKTYFAFTPFFYFNVGQYNNYKQVLPNAINLGANRWQFRQELNFTKGFEVIPGHNAYFEVTLGLDEFTNNTDFGRAGQTLKQNPLLTVESHLSYDITQAVFASIDYYGHYGGSYKVDPANKAAGFSVGAAGETALGGSIAYSFAPGFQLMLQYRGDVAVANGPRANIFLARFLWATDTKSLLGNPQAK